MELLKQIYVIIVIILHMKKSNRKLNVMKRLGLFLTAFFIIFTSSFSQSVTPKEEITITAEASQSSVPLNHTVDMVIEIKWKGGQGRYVVDNFDNPTITGFTVAGTSSSNVVEDINGVLYSRKVYVFTLKPAELGMGYIDGAFLKYTDSETGKSNTVVTKRISIKVTNPVYETDYSPVIYSIIILFVLITAGFLIYRIVRNKRKRAEELIASRQTERDIEGEFKEELKNYLPDVSADLNAFLNSISQLLYRYIAQKYGVETAGLTKDEITAVLKEKNAGERIIGDVGSFIEKSDVYRFSGTRIELSEYEQVYSLLESIVE